LNLRNGFTKHSPFKDDQLNSSKNKSHEFRAGSFSHSSPLNTDRSPVNQLGSVIPLTIQRVNQLLETGSVHASRSNESESVLYRNTCNTRLDGLEANAKKDTVRSLLRAALARSLNDEHGSSTAPTGKAATSLTGASEAEQSVGDGRLCIVEDDSSELVS